MASFISGKQPSVESSQQCLFSKVHVNVKLAEIRTEVSCITIRQLPSRASLPFYMEKYDTDIHTSAGNEAVLKSRCQKLQGRGQKSRFMKRVQTELTAVIT